MSHNPSYHKSRPLHSLKTKGTVLSSQANPEKNAPRVSIITVVRNDANMLEHTIQSVLNQTHTNIEYIIIDGGSTDGTVDIIRKYDDKIAYWVSEPDRGIYDAMNKGIDHATGDWINFMNAGDFLYDAEAVRQCMKNCYTNVDLIYGHCQLIYGSDTAVIWKAENLRNLWKGMVFRHQSLFTRSSICKDLRFDLSYKIGADFDFIYRCYQKGFQFRCLDLTIASITVGGLSDRNIMEGICENYRTVRQNRNNLKVAAYYSWLFVHTLIKYLMKQILPARFMPGARMLKFGLRKKLFGEFRGR